jgi:hypothetical protein
MDHRELARLYNAATPRFRLVFSGGLVAFSIFGIWATNRLEEIFPPQSKNIKGKSPVDLQWQKEIEKELE